MTTHTFVTFSESNGAEVVTFTEEQLKEFSDEAGGDWLACAKLYTGYGDADCIMTVKDARDAARFILDNTKE